MLKPTARVVRRKHRRVELPSLAGRSRVKVGFLGSAQADKAFWNEFGTMGGASGGGWGGPVPERPFFRTALRENGEKYRARLRAGARMILQAADRHRRDAAGGVVAVGVKRSSAWCLALPARHRGPAGPREPACG
jgi:hypothetical protein